MAEAFLSHYAANQFEVYSGGYKPLPIHPLAVKVMQEIGYDLSNQQSKDMWALIKGQHFGVAVSVCRKTEPNCPVVFGASTRINWDIEDPTVFAGSDQEKLDKFRTIRDQIHQHVLKFLEERSMVVPSF
jgi:arsenate reductase